VTGGLDNLAWHCVPVYGSLRRKAFEKLFTGTQLAMIEHFKQFFEKHLSPPADNEAVDQECLHLATAALLVEMTRADGEVRADEQAAVARALRKAFDIGEEKTAELIRLAESEITDATCYHQFTSLINKNFSKVTKGASGRDVVGGGLRRCRNGKV